MQLPNAEDTQGQVVLVTLAPAVAFIADLQWRQSGPEACTVGRVEACIQVQVEAFIADPVEVCTQVREAVFIQVQVGASIRGRVAASTLALPVEWELTEALGVPASLVLEALNGHDKTALDLSVCQDPADTGGVPDAGTVRRTAATWSIVMGRLIVGAALLTAGCVQVGMVPVA